MPCESRTSGIAGDWVSESSTRRYCGASVAQRGQRDPTRRGLHAASRSACAADAPRLSQRLRGWRALCAESERAPQRSSSGQTDLVDAIQIPARAGVDGPDHSSRRVLGTLRTALQKREEPQQAEEPAAERALKRRRRLARRLVRCRTSGGAALRTARPSGAPSPRSSPIWPTVRSTRPKPRILLNLCQQGTAVTAVAPLAHVRRDLDDLVIAPARSIAPTPSIVARPSNCPSNRRDARRVVDRCQRCPLDACPPVDQRPPRTSQRAHRAEMELGEWPGRRVDDGTRDDWRSGRVSRRVCLLHGAPGLDLALVSQAPVLEQRRRGCREACVERNCVQAHTAQPSRATSPGPCRRRRRLAPASPPAPAAAASRRQASLRRVRSRALATMLTARAAKFEEAKQTTRSGDKGGQPGAGGNAPGAFPMTADRTDAAQAAPVCAARSCKASTVNLHAREPRPRAAGQTPTRSSTETRSDTEPLHRGPDLLNVALKVRHGDENAMQGPSEMSQATDPRPAPAAPPPADERFERSERAARMLRCLGEDRSV